MRGERIGQLASATGVSARAIRHDDGLGLLTPTRGDNPCRAFQVEDVGRVKLIQMFLGTGFRLDEIRERVPCFRYGQTTLGASVEEVRVLYACKIADVDAQIAGQAVSGQVSPTD
ncbi:MerR family transcriptional regulator [Deinococcus marmoris]|uniref:MerR family transcriptional regulator n=1 Tax=Deinococcus marmoris TaxID=249408 RepID=UPI00096AC9E5|nr:MerR family transcriptional regulator [Deinococcus marmoris]